MKAQKGRSYIIINESRCAAKESRTYSFTSGKHKTSKLSNWNALHPV